MLLFRNTRQIKRWVPIITWGMVLVFFMTFLFGATYFLTRYFDSNYALNFSPSFDSDSFPLKSEKLSLLKEVLEKRKKEREKIVGPNYAFTSEKDPFNLP